VFPRLARMGATWIREVSRRRFTEVLEIKPEAICARREETDARQMTICAWPSGPSARNVIRYCT
jgi:hypothetical protein